MEICVASPLWKSMEALSTASYCGVSRSFIILTDVSDALSAGWKRATRTRTPTATNLDAHHGRPVQM